LLNKITFQLIFSLNSFVVYLEEESLEISNFFIVYEKSCFDDVKRTNYLVFIFSFSGQSKELSKFATKSYISLN